ncbi:peptidase, partial [Streptomyces sp. Ru87]
MASNSPAPESWFATTDSGPRFDEEPQGDWNPTAGSTAPVRGRHRVVKQ